MKLNFRLEKLFCCILLSLIMTSGNIFYSLGIAKNKIYADEYDCNNGCAYINPFILSSGVMTSGWLHYTYSFDQDGNKIFNSVTRVQTYFLSDGGYYWKYYGQPYTLVLSSIGNQVTIMLYGTLCNTLSGKEEFVNGIFSIQI